MTVLTWLLGAVLVALLCLIALVAGAAIENARRAWRENE